ncbi:hypothetical protein A6I77_24525 [Achromobacter xylosoxidans]|nr:hypothetical protein A6I77_24525 [Achromobacter xylosoxidans]
MNMCDSETEASAADRRAACIICAARWMLAVAVITPIAAAFSFWMPESQTTAQWLQRSGAITTVMSLLAIETLAFGISGLLPARGGFGDLYKMQAAAKHVPNVDALRALAIFITILGTLLWGYGDLIPLP